MPRARDLSNPEWPGGAEQGFWVLLLGEAKEKLERRRSQKGANRQRMREAWGAGRENAVFIKII